MIFGRTRKTAPSMIADLRRLHKTLAVISGQCEGGLVPYCPIIDSLFEEKHPETD